MAAVDMDAISFYQPPTATVLKRGAGSSPRSVGIKSVGFVSAGASQLDQWDVLLRQYDSTADTRTMAPVTGQDEIGGGGSSPIDNGADRAGSAPASEGPGADHADNQTDDESLPSLEELLDRKKDGTDAKVKCQSSQKQRVEQVLGSIDEPTLQIMEGAVNGGAVACSTFNAADISPSSYVDVLIGSGRDKTPLTAGHKNGPSISRTAAVADRRTPSVISELGSETGGTALSRRYCGFPSRQDRKGEKARVKPFGEGLWVCPSGDCDCFLDRKDGVPYEDARKLDEFNDFNDFDPHLLEG